MFIYKLLLLAIIAFPTHLVAQSYSGKWYGRAEPKTAKTYNSYLCELIILKKGNTITGELNYFFGQDEYKSKIKGVFFPATKTIELYPFKLITFFSSNPNGPDCEMDGSLTLYVDGEDSVLYGQLNPVSKYRSGCPVMEINLHKEGIEIEQPEEEVEPIVPFIPVIVAALEKDTLKQIAEPVKDTIEKAVVEALAGRNFSEGPLILVSTDSIELHLYDNGRIDNDTVSVFFNRKPVALQKRLNLKPLVIKLVLKPGENEIAMFADNLGDIPPNTALCIIYSGGQRFDINLSSNLASNGTVRIKKKE
jgi:hypothetical protein